MGKIRFATFMVFALFIPLASFGAEVNVVASQVKSVGFSNPLPALFTPDMLFDRMERKSEKVEAIESEVMLFDAVSSLTVKLCVKSPDKFSIIFSDESSKIYFNGSKLWIFNKSLNECFYHYSEPSQSWYSFGSVMSWFDPKKFFVNMTRGTLSALFEITALKREKVTDSDYHYHLKFEPKFQGFFREVFSLGYYEAVFSEKLYLPVKVIEYDTTGLLKSTLIVNSYKINEEVSDQAFEYVNSTKAAMIPVSIVILQKIEDYKDKLAKKLNETKKAITERFFNWSF